MKTMLGAIALGLTALAPGAVGHIHDCDFETDLCYFSSGCANGNCKWVRNSGVTDTFESGPSGAAEGSYYAYTPTAGNSFRQFRLSLPNFFGVGITFYYHM